MQTSLLRTDCYQDGIFHHLLRTVTAPPPGSTHPEMLDYATAYITTTLPEIQAHFTQTWRPQPKTIKDMARRLTNRWFKVAPQQTSAQHVTITQRDASIQPHASTQHDASIGDATQRNASVQLPLPALQVDTMPVRSTAPLSAPETLKQEEPAPVKLEQEEMSK